MTESHTPSHPPSSAALLKAKKRSSGPSWTILLVIMFVLIALVAVGVTWFQQKRFESAGREVASQVLGLTSQVNEARRDTAQALGLAQSLSGRVAQLEQAQLEAKTQYAALEQLWMGANKGMEDTMLANDIDRLLTTANQQLRLAGNVNNAIVTLEAAQSLLIRAERPRFSGVQKAITLDLDRLRAVPLVDIPQLSGRLESLSVLLARAPLVLPDAAAPRPVEFQSGSGTPPAVSVTSSTSAAASPSDTLSTSISTAAPQNSPSWWQIALDRMESWSKSAATFVVREFAQVVSIQRLSDANASLMSPEQGALLRANLRTRVLTAQMALLMHQVPVWKAELNQVEQSLVTRYDPKSPDTLAAIRLVKELAALQIAVPLPEINDSIAALESVRASEPTQTGGQ